MSVEREEFRVPKGVEKYKEIDLKLLPGERVERIVTVSQASRLRNYLLCFLIALLGLSLYKLFSLPKASIEALIPSILIFLALYFVWRVKVIDSVKKLIWSLFKYGFYVLLFAYFLTFLSHYLTPMLALVQHILPSGLVEPLQGLSTPRFSLDPIENVRNVLTFFVDLVNRGLIAYADHGRLIGIGLVAAGVAAVPLVFFSVRGHLYYVTDRRIVVRSKFGTVQVSTLPLDGVVEVTAFQGLFGRVFRYGDVIVTMTSGGGVTDSLAPQPTSPLQSLYGVKRRLEGVKEPWELKDLVISLRDKYVEARYLARIEEELKRIRESVEVKEVKAPLLVQERKEKKREDKIGG